MRGVALNFFPLRTREFSFEVHARPAEEGESKPQGDDDVSRRALPKAESEDYGQFWTYWVPNEGTAPVECEAFTNVYLTQDFLRRELIKRCHAALAGNEFDIEVGFWTKIYIVLAQFPEGDQVVSLEPYLLRSKGQFGFLADFRFRARQNLHDSKRVQQLSLSLDKQGRSNSNYYADKYEKLLEFVNRFHDRLFPLQASRAEIAVSRKLTVLEPTMLSTKTYVVQDQRMSRSQFMGVKKQGPLEAAPADTTLHFVYRPQDKPLSHDLFRALRGDTFKTFPGMEQMFGLPLTDASVSGTPLKDFSDAELATVSRTIIEHAERRPVVPVVITPFSRHDDPEENEAYWRLKHRFLRNNVPIQVVAAETIRDRSKLKWSSSGIALQIFAKAGGIPWKVKPQHERCLIVGIGQAHRQSEEGVERYFAYSVLTDSSGVFEEVRILGEGPDEEAYLGDFAASLRQILLDYGPRFDRFVVHATFAIRGTELDRIEKVLREFAGADDEATREFVSMKFNDRTRFFGYATDHNSRVPYESTTLQLANDEHLVWFEGLHYGKPAVKERVGGPVHVRFNYPRRTLTADDQRSYLQDAINLSGANWRGFNAKSLPVSVYYAQLIARYMREFDAHDLPEVDLTTLTPWFL